MPLPRLPARRLLLLALWLAFVSYAFVCAPPGSDTTKDLILDAILFRSDRLDVSVIAVFNLLGVLPTIYASLLLADGAGRKLKAWPFVLGSCFLGAFALLPYLALREDDGRFLGKRQGAIRLFDSRALGVGLLVVTLLLVGLGLFQGELSRYLALFHSDSLVHVMTLDLIALSLVFPSALGSDMERRGLRNSTWFWLIAAVPLLGPAIYVAFRPRLSDATV